MTAEEYAVWFKDAQSRGVVKWQKPSNSAGRIWGLVAAIVAFVVFVTLTPWYFAAILAGAVYIITRGTIESLEES